MAMTPHATSSHRSVSPRIAELPSLRYGTIGASCVRSGPLKVGGTGPPSNETTAGLMNRYRRSATSPDVAGLGKPARTTARHVRFDIPSATLPSRENGAGPEPSVRGQSATSKQTSTQQRYTAQRHHTTGRYVKGTLSPTASASGAVAAPSRAAPGITGTPRPPIPPAATSSEHGTTKHVYKSLVSRFSVTPTHKKYQQGDLLRAAREADETAIREIVRRGVMVGIPESELNAVDATGRTPVSYIVSNGTVEILEAILQIPGVDINKPDNEGNTPLHFAAQAGQVECLNYLLSRCQNLEIDARNDLGFTPLMKAALQGRNKCAKLLLFAGASPTARDSGRGLRPDQWARYCGRYVCAEVIEKFAKNRNAHGTLPSTHERNVETRERGAGGGAGLVHGTGTKWGSDSDLASKLNAAATRSHSTAGGFRSKFRWIFRTTTGGGGGASYTPKTYNNNATNNNNNGGGGTISGALYADETSSTPRLASQLTAAAICASTPLLPTNATSSQHVRSLVRPLSVPKLHVTLANPSAASSNVDNFIPNNIPTGSYYEEAKKGAFYKRKK